MPRQRIRVRDFRSAELALRLLVTVIGLALAWYGAMTILLALKLSPDTVNAISGYRTVYTQLSSITAADITATDRIIVAAAGVLTFAVFATITWKALPRPYLARADVDLTDGEQRGATIVGPRAVERAAEFAALEHPQVAAASSRFGTADLAVAVNLRSPEHLADTLREIQTQVGVAIEDHGLPSTPVQVTLAGLDRSNQRELL